eukprot:TRINITY_DN14207_c0_g1_i4.p1 TRINITY_DN14207_c0_g1~~TRINITY_DN14207_c0_g1_i4.p1  ORF type:complete len:217 (-),score=10.38 TRINITY_DN14207_c0_g1_i4:313-963(-)
MMAGSRQYARPDSCPYARPDGLIYLMDTDTTHWMDTEPRFDEFLQHVRRVVVSEGWIDSTRHSLAYHPPSIQHQHQHHLVVDGTNGESVLPGPPNQATLHAQRASEVPIDDRKSRLAHLSAELALRVHHPDLASAPCLQPRAHLAVLLWFQQHGVGTRIIASLDWRSRRVLACGNLHTWFSVEQTRYDGMCLCGDGSVEAPSGLWANQPTGFVDLC